METFAPESNGARLQRGFPIQPQYAVAEDVRELGNVKSVAIAQKALRRYQLTYRCPDRSGFEYIESFFQYHVGSAGRFLWATPEFASTPFKGPTLEAVVAGAQSSRTIFCKYAWKTTAGRTRASPATSLTVPLNSLLKVTVPVFPPSVTHAVIYATQGAAGTEQEQIEITSLTWTQPDAALLTATTSPETTNAARETVTAKLVAGSYAAVRGIGTQYEVSMELEETYS